MNIIPMELLLFIQAKENKKRNNKNYSESIIVNAKNKIRKFIRKCILKYIRKRILKYLQHYVLEFVSRKIETFETRKWIVKPYITNIYGA